MRNEFYESFVKLHTNRIESFFEKVISKNDFISDLICIFTEGVSVSDPIAKSISATNKLKNYLNCDLYSSELLTVDYKNGDLKFVFEIYIKLKDEGNFVFYLHHFKDDYSIKNEEIESESDDDEFWEKVTKKLNAELTFGTLKRS
jgi:hypothetical protein